MHLLVEVGTEELPALAAPELASALGERLIGALAEGRLPHGEAEIYWTHRRLAVLVRDLGDRQEDLVEEVRGPAVAVGLDDQGHPTPAALGFARRFSVSQGELYKRRVGEKEYLFLARRTPGRLAGEVLPELLAQAIREVPCPKTMRWDDSGLSFLRPIRWLVCLWGEEIIPTRLGNLVAGRTTRGHRFFGPPKVQIPTPSWYLEGLREAKVEASPGERRDRILAEVRRVEEEHQVQAALDEELLGRLVGGAEWPAGVVGTIPEEFLELPAPMIEATLAAEGKFVPFSRDGRPAEVFLGFRDGAKDKTGVVRQGYERVVRARLRDSRFFFRHDRRQSLADRVRLLRGVVYEGRLGTVWERVERIRAICAHLAHALDLPAELLDRAAFLAKADLTTEVVREFPELEGVMGGIYASLDGEPPEVAQAIGEHLRPRGPNSALPKTKLGAALSLGDKLDAVVGAIRVGLVPTGSHDPYGIRRRGAAVVRLVLELGLSVDLFAVIDATADLYPGDLGDPSLVKTFLLDRLRAALQRDFAYDVVDAVLAVPRGDFLGARARAEALTRLRDEGSQPGSLPYLADLVLAFGRVRNITQGCPQSEFDPELFQEEAERELWRAYLRAEGRVREALARGDYEGAIRSLHGLRDPIDRYFDQVLVMTDDPRLRQNRLGFLCAVRGLFLEIGDLSRLVMS